MLLQVQFTWHARPFSIKRRLSKSGGIGKQIAKMFRLHSKKLLAVAGARTAAAAASSAVDLPDSARVVVVGGGIIGCSVAYHLAHMGCENVVLLERDQLTSGTTWHAAGVSAPPCVNAATNTLRMHTEPPLLPLYPLPASISKYSTTTNNSI